MGLIILLAFAVQLAPFLWDDLSFLAGSTGVLFLGALLAGKSRPELARLLWTMAVLPAGWLALHFLPISGWPSAQLAPLVLLLLVSPLTGGPSKTLGTRAGTLRKHLRWVLVVVLVASAALGAWFWFHPEKLSAQASQIPTGGIWSLIGMALGFSAVNALLEEVYFRGALLAQLERVLVPPVAVFLQGVSFGAIHFLAGVPCGWWGLGMTCVYGWMLGALRLRSQGLVAPWLAHLLADLCIFGGVLWAAGLGPA